jgi:tetratricopeptide (TPR) repeat protein
VVLRILTIAGTVLLLALPLAGQQQDSSSSGSSSTQQSQSSSASTQKKNQSGSPSTAKQNNDQKPAPKPASTAGQNLFPEAQSEKAQQQDRQQPQQDNAPSAPAPQTAQPAKGSSTAAQNPFPEEQSEKAAEKDQQQQKADQDYSSSSSGVKGLNLPAEARPLAAGAPGNTGFSPDLALKDVKIGNFYLQTNNYKGAYDRFLEATQVNPGSVDAVYGVAEAARHLNKRDEAIQYYQIYLAALPDGPRAKDARKALKEMGAEPKQ